MIIGQFWGTSAAEGTPAPFCRCEGCLHARKVGGKNIKTRSCFRLTDKIMIDLGADAVQQAIKYGDIADVEHVLVSHTHDDHLNPHMLMEAMWSKNYRKPLHYYFTDKAFDIVDHWRNNSWILKGKVRSFEEEGLVVFHQWEYGKRYELDGLFITPIRGAHFGNVGENTALFLIELPDGRTLFHGLDSGPYYPETLEALKGRHIDHYIVEAAAGLRIPNDKQHINFPMVRELADQLIAQGTLDETSTLYISHINHYTSHDASVEAIEKLNFPIKTIVAYDGLRIL